MFEVQNNKQVNFFDVMQEELAKEAVRHRFRGLENQFSITPNIIRSDQTYLSSMSTVPIHQNIDIGKIIDSGDLHDYRNAIFGFAAEICNTCWRLSVELFTSVNKARREAKETTWATSATVLSVHNIPRYVRNNRDLEPKEVQKVPLPSFLREYIIRQWATSSIYLRAYKVSDPISEDFTLMDSRNPNRRIIIKSAQVKVVRAGP